MFSWDARKALRNYRKHGVSFEEASTVSSVPMPWIGRTWSNRRSAAGSGSALSTEGRALLVVYTLRRLGNGIETIRIISARQASRREREAYAG